MRIQIRCCGYIAVPKPLLHFYQGNLRREQKAWATVSAIVEADSSQPMFFEQSTKSPAQSIGLQQIACFIDTDITAFFFMRFKKRKNKLRQRQCSIAGFAFQNIPLYDLPFSFDGDLIYWMDNVDKSVIKINVFPSQPQYFATTQPIKQRNATGISNSVPDAQRSNSAASSME